MLAHLPPTPPERAEAPTRSAPSAGEAGRTPEGARFAELLRGQRPASAASAAATTSTATARPPTAANRTETAADERPVPDRARPASGTRRELFVAHRTPEADTPPVDVDAKGTIAAQGAPADPAEIGASTDRTTEDARATATGPAAAAYVAGAPAALPSATAAQGLAAPATHEAPRLLAGRARREPAAADAAAAQVPCAGLHEPAGDAAGAAGATAPLAAAAPGADGPRNTAPARDPAALLAPAGAPESLRAPGPAATSSLALPTPLAAPNFGEALATKVSIFARDGLQQAELRLNPPEMGPIGVQIEVTGSEARIHFHAAQAATREVIERALPDLAGALRSEGLTLAGGGVFDRPADARDGGFAQGREGARTQREPADAPAQPRALRMAHVAQGRLDVFA